MTMMNKTLNATIKDNLVKPVTMTELEEASGADIGSTLSAMWRAAKCQAGFHDYNIRFEHKPYSGSWILSQAVKTCKYCGHQEKEGWVIK